MTPYAVPYGRKAQKPSPVSDAHVLWITAGLGCDGDSVSVAAATQPSIEDATDPDHVVVVTTIVSRQKSILRPC
jgi:hypothetical protein